MKEQTSEKNYKEPNLSRRVSSTVRIYCINIICLWTCLETFEKNSFEDGKQSSPSSQKPFSLRNGYVCASKEHCLAQASLHSKTTDCEEYRIHKNQHFRKVFWLASVRFYRSSASKQLGCISFFKQKRKSIFMHSNSAQHSEWRWVHSLFRLKYYCQEQSAYCVLAYIPVFRWILRRNLISVFTLTLYLVYIVC